MHLYTIRHHPVPALAKAKRKASQAGTRVFALDTMDDRVTDNIFDVEDEHAEVDIIVRGIGSDAY